ncbi:chromosome partitioning protein, ParB family [Rhodospira trueperi]|uniref:Chromosome partitioning protein, ParB family n=2 Tax=Rhodospira trueperi TaxID=69960 RepID=A0A1G6W5G8_9PROT|nr:chromosome partitioning protein, ParB family [Rhodospira trueperi]
MDALLSGYPEPTELPEGVDARVGEIEAALKGFETRPATFEPDEVSRAGAFISIDLDGEAHIERGFVRPEDEPPLPAPEADPDAQATAAPDGVQGEPVVAGAMPEANAPGATQATDPDPDPVDDPLRPLPDRLVTELTAHRTLALRDALASHPDTAFMAVLHALCLSTFHRHAVASCLEITGRSGPLAAQAPGLKDSASAQSLDARQDAWIDRLPADPRDLWGALQALSSDERMACWPIAPRAPSTRWSSPGTVSRVAPTTPTRWPGRPGWTWSPPDGARPSRPTWGGYPRRASWPPSVKR